MVVGSSHKTNPSDPLGFRNNFFIFLGGQPLITGGVTSTSPVNKKLVQTEFQLRYLEPGMIQFSRQVFCLFFFNQDIWNRVRYSIRAKFYFDTTTTLHNEEFVLNNLFVNSELSVMFTKIVQNN